MPSDAWREKLRAANFVVVEAPVSLTTSEADDELLGARLPPSVDPPPKRVYA
jgi:hypothetical protein